MRARTGVPRRSALVPSDRASITSYRLSIVTMPLTEAVWPQFAMRVFGVQSVPPFGGNRGCKVSVGQPYLHTAGFVANC